MFFWGMQLLFCGGVMPVMTLTLYSRSYCHLCDDMLVALTPLLQGRDIPVRVVDVDTDPALVALYDELVPVLVGQRGEEAPQRLCHYHLDKAAVAAFLVRN